MLSGSRMQALLQPYVEELSPEALEQLTAYVDLVLRWNTRTNLTAIRDPETLVQRQLGESLFAARFLRDGTTLLDFGSGAGFPGIPLLIAMPGLRVTLAESQGKKAAFLREAVRSLGLTAQVWSGRVESMPASDRFDTVVMRAVDRTDAMLPLAMGRVSPDGSLLRYLAAEEPTGLEGWTLRRSEAIPGSQGMLAMWTRTAAAA